MSILTALLLAPLIGSALTYVVGKSRSELSGIIASFFAILSFIFALLLFFDLSNEKSINVNLFNWFYFAEYNLNFSLTYDKLSSVMCFLITGIGSLIHIYSIDYMKEDENRPRYFAYLNLFLFFMLLLVLGSNLLVLFAGWEGVGLCSYLLIGFWFDNNLYASSGKKAFVLNRIGDAGFLIAIFAIFKMFGTLDFIELEQNYIANIDEFWLTIACLGLFLGASGKSAQFPLSVWLPDAMAGPTPVSALIHAATMVTAGLYLLARTAYLFAGVPFVQEFIFYIALITATLAGLTALAQNDLKKILAYSTVSQLGIMFMAVASGAYWIALFHITTHAFFKACLFLSAGNIIHSLNGEQDIRKMGGLRRKLPVTFYCYLVSTLAISGIYPLSGYFSKHLVVEFTTMQFGFGVFLTGLSLLTTLYMTRSLYYVFFGEEKENTHFHKPSLIMKVPILVLALGAILSGFVWEGFFIDNHCMEMDCSNFYSSFFSSILSSIPSLVTLLLTLIMFIKLKNVLSVINQIFNFPIIIFKNKFFIDEIYNLFIVKTFKFLASVFAWIERVIIDWTINSFAVLAEISGFILRFYHNGSLRNYNLNMLFFTFILVLFCFLI